MRTRSHTNGDHKKLFPLSHHHHHTHSCWQFSKCTAYLKSKKKIRKDFSKQRTHTVRVHLQTPSKRLTRANTTTFDDLRVKSSTSNYLWYYLIRHATQLHFLYRKNSLSLSPLLSTIRQVQNNWQTVIYLLLLLPTTSCLLPILNRLTSRTHTHSKSSCLEKREVRKRILYSLDPICVLCFEVGELLFFSPVHALVVSRPPAHLAIHHPSLCVSVCILFVDGY